MSIIATGGSNSVNDSDRLSSRGDMQTPAEKQAAAKMALRKQLEKTLLQVIYAKNIYKNVTTFKIIIIIVKSNRFHHQSHQHPK